MPRDNRPVILRCAQWSVQIDVSHSAFPPTVMLSASEASPCEALDGAAGA